MQIYTKTNETIQKPRGLISVLSGKLSTYVEKNKMSKVIRMLFELIAGVALAVFTLMPGEVTSVIENLLKTKDFAVPKVSGILLLFFYRKALIRTGKSFFRNLSKNAKKVPLLDGIPVPELVDYLLRNQHFRREGVNGVRETFGMNMQKFNRLASKLEENGVLIRGENNGRLLDGKWSRQALIDYLCGEDRSEELQPHFSIHRIGTGHKIRLMNSEMAI